MGTGRLLSFSIAGAGWMTRVDWAAPLLVLLASSRRTTARAADGHGRRGVLSHVLLEALYLRGFFPPSQALWVVFRLLLLLFFFFSGVEQLSASSKTSNVAALRWSCAALLFALRVGRGNPTTRRVYIERTTAAAG